MTRASAGGGSGAAPARLAYVLSRFPLLSETFILREMSELVRRGHQLDIVPLVVERPRTVHPEAAALEQRVRSLGLGASRTAASIARTVRLRPWHATRVALEALALNRASRRFLARAMVVAPKALAAGSVLQRSGTTHVHAHYGTHSALLAWMVHRLTGLPYSVTVHGHDLTVDRTMLARKLSDASFVIAPSHYHRRCVEAAAGDAVAAKTHVVHCGIELDRYRPAPATRDRAAALEILSIGSLQPYKGFRHLVDALRLLRERGLVFRCRIIGAGPTETELRRRIAAADLDGTVELLGARTQQQVAELLSTAHCYVQPSIVTSSGKTEGLPVALMEALACELPVVASDVGGVSELVRPGRTGVLVPAADASALAASIESVAEDWDAAKIEARAGRALIEREFDLRRTVDRLEALFASSRAGARHVAVAAAP
jgi:glycosyltransferase involved in cell wall biosynthesis